MNPDPRTTARQRVKRAVAGAKGQAVRLAGRSASAALRMRRTSSYRPGTTVLTVNWNSREFLRRTLPAIRVMSPEGTTILVVDNASTDGSRELLRDETVESLLLPVNFGHGLALDLAIPRVDTEFVAILDVDAFPVSDRWLQESIAALDGGAKAAGARLHRNFVHPSFFVARTETLHRFGLTFRPVGSLRRLATRAPLFLDVGEALSQRLIVKFGGGGALHLFEATSTRGPGVAGSVFGGLVYHNLYSTQGLGQAASLGMFAEEFRRHHPTLEVPHGAEVPRQW